MLLVYKGVKNPKVVEIKGKRIEFVPREQVEVLAPIGRILLKNAADIFEEMEVTEKPSGKSRK